MAHNNSNDAPMQSISEILQRMPLAPDDAQQATINVASIKIYPREEDESEGDESAPYYHETDEKFATEVDCDDYEREYRKPKEQIVSETTTPTPVPKPLLIDD